MNGFQIWYMYVALYRCTCKQIWLKSDINFLFCGSLSFSLFNFIYLFYFYTVAIVADNRPMLKTFNLTNVWALFLFLLTYLLNQLDRFLFGITAKSMAQEIHFGDRACMINTSFVESDLVSDNGTSFKCEATSQDRYVWYCHNNRNNTMWQVIFADVNFGYFGPKGIHKSLPFVIFGGL